MTQDPNIANLAKQLERLNAHPFLQSHSSWTRMLGYQLLRGLAFGLGSVIGATVLVALLVYMLGEIDFIPVIGDWAKEILTIINSGN